MKNNWKDILLGVAIGDALGVPAEFQYRNVLDQYPVTTMTGFGTHNQPAGTFSDDSSLTFCLAEALANGFSNEQLAKNCMKWLYEGYWTAYGDVFDAGISTQAAIERLKRGVTPVLAGGTAEEECGNGSLMRILPLLPYLKNKPIEERFVITQAVSSVTHRHIRPIIACFYYLEFARLLLSKDKFVAYAELKETLPATLESLGIATEEINHFNRLLADNIFLLPVTSIESSGYVLHTLEASIWCLLTTTSYEASALKAVNLGSDTDTTAAVTGGIAGILYGYESIPKDWVAVLARRVDIEELAERAELRVPFS